MGCKLEGGWTDESKKRNYYAVPFDRSLLIESVGVCIWAGHCHRQGVTFLSPVPILKCKFYGQNILYFIGHSLIE